MTEDGASLAIDLALTFHISPYELLNKPRHELLEIHRLTMQHLERTKDG